MYHFATQHGAFSEAQIGNIAHQLLSALACAQINDVNIIGLTPGSVMMKKSNKNSSSDSPISLKLVNIAALKLVFSQVSSHEITGIDRLFLAPEIN